MLVNQKCEEGLVNILCQHFETMSAFKLQSGEILSISDFICHSVQWIMGFKLKLKAGDAMPGKAKSFPTEELSQLLLGF